MAYEGCHVFAPLTKESPPRSLKRKRTVPPKAHDGVLTTLFVPLTRSITARDDAEARCEVFEDIWQQRCKSLDNIFEHAYTKLITSLKEFVYSTYEKNQQGKIPTGLLLHGPGNGAITGLYGSLSRTLSSHGSALCVKLDSGQSPNLKTVLKYINRAAASQVDDDDDKAPESNRLLNYDLQILCDYVNGKALSRVALLFEDGEAFDGGLLSDLIDILSFWKDRIPFVLFFGIATSVELFQSKLYLKAVRCLEGKQFDVAQADPEEIFKMAHKGSNCLFLGPGLTKLLLDRQRDFILNPRNLLRALKYAYMAHFFSNPLSSMLDPRRATQKRDQEHYAAIRHLPSFRRVVQHMVDSKRYTLARKLLDDNTELEASIMHSFQENPSTLKDLVLAVDLLFICVRMTNLHIGKILPTWSELYILAMSDKLGKSLVLEETLDLIKEAKSSVLQDIIKSVLENLHDHLPRISKINEELATLLHHLVDGTVLRSSYDIQRSNVRTTIVAQKVELNRHTAKLTHDEKAYTTIVDKFSAELESFFQSKLVNPQELFLHEIFIYDAKALHRDVFTPRPRFAIERALSSPHDYLGCDCCDNATGGFSASQPATAIVYQLYLESGSIINIADLWAAFWTIVGAEKGEDMEEERETALALFSRAMAELKYLGMIKNSRRKADHLAKLLWKGL